MKGAQDRENPRGEVSRAKFYNWGLAPSITTTDRPRFGSREIGSTVEGVENKNTNMHTITMILPAQV